MIDAFFPEENPDPDQNNGLLNPNRYPQVYKLMGSSHAKGIILKKTTINPSH